MNKVILIIVSILFAHDISAQKTTKPTNEFVIDGLVENNTIINIDSLKKYPTIWIDSMVILNHKGEIKSTLRNIAAIPASIFLNRIKIKVESPKQLSEFYFVFEAADNYKVVFSWNEIFNTKVGREIYIIIEKDGKKIDELDDKIAIISPTDFMTGRRYVKGLYRITIKRTE